MSKKLPARAPRLPRLVLVFLVVVYFLYFGLYANQRYLAAETGAFDLGVYAQPLWNFIEGRGFAVSLIEDNGPSRWATHVEPFLFLIVPLYRLWPDPRLLLWLQVAGMSLAALPLYALARRRLRSEWAALAVVLAYMLMPATEAVTLFDFHAVSFAPLFLLAAIFFLDQALIVQGKSFWVWPEGVRNQRIGESANQRISESANRRVSEAVSQRISEAGAEGRLQLLRTAGAEWAGQASANQLASEPVSQRVNESVSQPVPPRRQRHASDTLPKARNTQHAAKGTQATRFTFHASRFYLLSALSFLLALSTKEDISLHVFMLGLYLLVLRRRWWEGGILAVVGLAWFYIAFQVVIPAFRTGGGHSIYAAWFESLGRTPLEIALSPFTAPDKVLALLARPGSITALGMLLIPQALLPLAGLPLLLLAAPSLAFSLLSQNPTLRQLETWHYAAPMLPFVMLGTIDGMARLAFYGSYYVRRRTQSRRTFRRTILAVLALALIFTSLIYHHLRGYSVLSWLYEWPEATAHHRLGQEIARTIPAEASVLAQAQLVSYVAHREGLGIWNGPLDTDYDYIWLDLSHPMLPNRFNAHGELLTGLTIEPDFGFAAMQDGYLLLHKGADRPPLAEELFTFTQFDRLPARAQTVSAVFGETLELVGFKPEVRRLATSETEPQLVLYFQARQKPSQDFFLFLYLLDQTGAITGATDYPQPALFWWPTSRWEAGDQRQVRVNTIPWWTGDKSTFGYALGISRRDDPWDVSARLPVTAVRGTVPPIEQGTLLPLVAFRRLAGLSYPQPPTILPLGESK